MPTKKAASNGESSKLIFLIAIIMVFIGGVGGGAGVYLWQGAVQEKVTASETEESTNGEVTDLEEEESINETLQSAESALSSDSSAAAAASLPDTEDIPLPDHIYNNEAAETVFDETPHRDYILPFSGIRLITTDDLRHLSGDELRIARNEIFARHGRRFADMALQNYFNSMDWYTPRLALGEEPALSDLELTNATFILNFESEITD
jgi:hypothetical protein